MRLLPDDIAASLTAYREPGPAELPLVFRATSAPIVRAASNSRAYKIINRRSVARAETEGFEIYPDNGGVSRGTTLASEDTRVLRQEKDEEAYISRVVRAKACGAGGGGDGGDEGLLKANIRTRLPAPSEPEGRAGDEGGIAHAETNDGSCDFVSSGVWSG